MSGIFKRGKGEVKVVRKSGKTVKYEARKPGMKGVVVENSADIANAILKELTKSKEAMQRALDSDTKYHLPHSSAQYVNPLAAAMRKDTRKSILNNAINKQEMIRKAQSGIFSELNKLWEEYQKEAKETFQIMYDDFMARCNEAKLPPEMYKYMEKYAKDKFLRVIDPSRQQEFFSFVMSGQLKNFNPMDFTPHWMRGDIVLKDDSERESHIQLKQTGGHFRVGFTENYRLNKLENTISNMKKGDNKSYARAVALEAASPFVEEMYKKFITNDKEYPSTPERNGQIMESYASATRADLVVINYTGIPPRANYSITLRKDQLADFARKNPSLFRFGMGGKGDTPGYPAYYELTVKDPKSISELAKLRFSSGGVFLHSYDEKLYYKKIGSRKSANVAKAADATDYIEKTVRPRWKEFIFIHESLFGPIKYKIEK